MVGSSSNCNFDGTTEIVFQKGVVQEAQGFFTSQSTVCRLFCKCRISSTIYPGARFIASSKVPMLNSIQLVNKMIDFHPLNEALSSIEKEVLSGNSLHGSMADNKIFDNKMISLVRVAEETNQTEYIFERLNQQYATAVQQKSKMLSTQMEPLIIIIVGIFVGIILISMYLPMFRLSTVIG